MAERVLATRVELRGRDAVEAEIKRLDRLAERASDGARKRIREAQKRLEAFSRTQTRASAATKMASERVSALSRGLGSLSVVAGQTGGRFGGMLTAIGDTAGVFDGLSEAADTMAARFDKVDSRGGRVQTRMGKLAGSLPKLAIALTGAVIAGKALAAGLDQLNKLGEGENNFARQLEKELEGTALGAEILARKNRELAEAGLETADSLHEANQRVRAFRTGMKDLADEIINGDKAMREGLTQELGKLTTALRDGRLEIGELSDKALKRLGERVADMSAGFMELDGIVPPILQELSARLKDAGVDVDNLGKSIDNLSPAVRDFRDEEKRLTEMIEGFGTAFVEFSPKAEALRNNFIGLKDRAAELGIELDERTIALLKELGVEFEATGEKIAGMGAALDTAGGSVEQWVRDQKAKLEALRDVVDSPAPRPSRPAPSAPGGAAPGGSPSDGVARFGDVAGSLSDEDKKRAADVLAAIAARGIASARLDYIRHERQRGSTQTPEEALRQALASSRFGEIGMVPDTSEDAGGDGPRAAGGGLQRVAGAAASAVSAPIVAGLGGLQRQGQDQAILLGRVERALLGVSDAMRESVAVQRAGVRAQEATARRLATSGAGGKAVLPSTFASQSASEQPVTRGAIGGSGGGGSGSLFVALGGGG